jgi:hypothetical protein
MQEIEGVDIEETKQVYADIGYTEEKMIEAMGAEGSLEAYNKAVVYQAVQDRLEQVEEARKNIDRRIEKNFGKKFGKEANAIDFFGSYDNA